MKTLLFLFCITFLSNVTIAQNVISVSQKGNGNYKTIQDAINSLPTEANAHRVIEIEDGVYNEKIFIDKNFVTLRGKSREKVIVQISLARDEWRCSNNDDYGTATINLKGNDITLENITFINSYGKDNVVEKKVICTNDSNKIKSIRPTSHQMALRSFSTTRLKAINCTFTAYGGDTVSPWNTEDGMFYFKNCTMDGGVDFYCPRGWALAEDCTFICHSTEAAIWHDGSKHESSKTVLVNCNFKGDKGFVLGRYHRDAQFFLINCNFANEMADKDIFQREANPPNVINWGRRVYYYNCHRKGGNYLWHSNNFPLQYQNRTINEQFIFDDKWYPSGNTVEIKIPILNEEKASYINIVKDTASTDKVAEMMLLFQRNIGGWPKHFKDKTINYTAKYIEADLAAIKDEKNKNDATIDNSATTKEIRYLVTAYQKTKNENYLKAAKDGIQYLLKMQYGNGGFPQFYPDLSGYKHLITFNDNAMINALNVLQDVAEQTNGMEVIADKKLIKQSCKAVEKGVSVILDLQVKQNGKLTVWCAQHDEKSYEPTMARKFELASLSGNESVAIVNFLMRQPKPNKKIIAAITNAVAWFEAVQIKDVAIKEIVDSTTTTGKDRVVVKQTGNVLWARFYDLETNKPFFTGRNSEKMPELAMIENERRMGYAYYGEWPARLLKTNYPNWKKKNNIE